MTQSISSQTHMARIMLAVIFLTGAAGLTTHAATQTKPLTVTAPNQTISDDFDVTVNDGRDWSALTVSSSAAGSTKDTTQVDSQNIAGHFTQPANVKIGEANGIWVKANYPGTVKLADGLNVKVDATGTSYNSSGIYLEGVDTHHGKPYESVAANTEYKANGNKISDTTVHVGNNTTISVKASTPEGQQGTYVNAVALENHFGHMTVGDHVTLSTETGAFRENYSNGFFQLFYGQTSIGNHFTSKIHAKADSNTSTMRIAALRSSHDHQTDTQMPAIAQNRLAIGDDAFLETCIDVDSPRSKEQDLNISGAFLSKTDFSIGNRLQVNVFKIGSENAPNAENVNERDNVFGIFTRGGKGTIGDGLQNTVTVKQSTGKGIVGMEISGWSQPQGEKENDTDISDISIGSSSQNHVIAENSYAKLIRGIDVDSDSHVKMKEQGDVSIRITGGKTEELEGILLSDNSTMDMGNYGNISFVQSGGETNRIHGLYLEDKATMNMGSHGSISLVQADGETGIMSGIFLDNHSTLNMTQNETISNVQNGGQSDTRYGVYNRFGSTLTIGNGLETDLSCTGNGTNSNAFGLYNYSKSSMTVGDDSKISAVVKNASVDPSKSMVSGIRNVLASAQFGNNFSVQVQADNYETAEGIRNCGVDGTPANMIIGDGLSIAVKASALSNGNSPTVEGIRNGTNRLTGYTFSAGNTILTIGKNARISVAAPEKVTDVSAFHTFNYAAAEIGDDAAFMVNSTATDNNNVVKADTAGKVIFDGGLPLEGSQDAIYSTGSGSLVSAMEDGDKMILGNLEAADSGSIKLNLNTAASYFLGKSTVDGADTELTLSNGARWDMTGSSQITDLNLDNGGTVNMHYNPDYQRLDVNNYSGTDGIFRMKTDLNSQTDGDKVYMNGAASGSSGLVQVQDKSFLLGKEVTGTKHLLLITDNSQNATFSGVDLDEGGLWDVTPTIQNGSYVRNTMGDTNAKDTEWYLTKLTKTANADTKPLLGAVDYSYGLYRNSIDTLRQRMGDLRFLKNKRDAAGIWARSYGGELDGPGYDSKYHAIQVGYDYAANDKSLYGFLGERGIASPHYEYGSSKDHSLAGAIYGTWFGDSGSYTDVVAKWGRDDSNLHTYGPYADSANFRTSSESLSVEYGRTTKLNGHGLFIEPQAQLVVGRLNDKDFTTARGKNVHLDSYDSCIGRLGFVFGQRRPDASKPYDYYLKASVLHEFGGDRSFHLAAPDGETMDLTNHYGSTWYEAGFGGTYRVNNSTYLYADAERSFGSDWHKKWQANVGINWQF